MQKRLFALALFLFTSITFAQSFTSQVSTYGQQYENGEINYLQFNVLLNNEREKLFDTLNEGESRFGDHEEEREDGEEEFRGWDQDKMRQLFGEPTQMEQWAWSPLLKKSIKLTSPVAVWRKTLYDGRTIKVSLDSWPQVIQRDGQTTIFYHFDLRADYKEEESFDVVQMVAEFKNLAQASASNSEKQRDAAIKAVEIEKQLHSYLENNKRQCRETLAGWFGYSAAESSKLKWSATLYDGESVTVKLVGDEWTDQNWHGLSSWIDMQQRLDMGAANQEAGEVNFDYSAPAEYTAKMRETIDSLKRGAANLDANPSPDNLRFVESQRQQYQQLLNEFMNKVGRQQFEISNDEAVVEIEKIFAEQADFTKENVKQFEFKQRLLNFSREVTSSYCSGSETACGDVLTCSNAACIESTCGDLQCGPCQYQDRTTCTCVEARGCTPPPEEERPFEEREQPQGNQTQPQGGQQQQNQTQQQGEQSQQNQTQPQGEQPSTGTQNGSTTAPASVPRDPRDDGSCDCPPNPAPTCQPRYSAISREYQYNSSTCSYALTCWRTTCEFDSSATVKAAKVSGLLSTRPLTALVVDEPQPPSVCDPSQCSNPNQFCGSQGWCECQQGYWDCDGDWLNGCESTKQCTQCTTNSDCAASRCSEDHGRVVNFECRQGEVHSEETGGVEFGGNCAERNSGEFEANAWLGAWGDDFQQFDQFKQQAWNANDAKRCEAELGQLKRKRLELQGSLDDSFFKWFFDNFVSTNPNDFEKQGKAIRGIYEAFQRNSDDTARAMRCLGRTDWPAEYVPIKAEIATEFGKVQIWEEKKRTDFWGTDQEILSPYIKMWVFPPKEVFKRFFVEKIKEEGPQGPPPEDLAQMRNSPEAMAKIRTIANAFGGDARIIIQAVDGNEALVKFVFIVNERDLIKIESADNYDGPVSATVSVGLDFLYDVVSSVEKESNGERIEYPFWEKGQEPKRIVDEAVVAVKVFTRIFTGIAGGEIKIEPVSALPKIVFILQEMMSMIMMQGA